ncbi:MAG: chemotaxis protein CheW [Lachnospira sp.]|nr:chemotaxis protein CheW [Lachnospira sp.]
MADYTKPVIFRLGNQKFGVDINLIQSIERDINIVRVPNAMSYISGIVNLRGEVIPAFSLRKKFGTDDSVGIIGEDSTVIVNIPGVVKLALEVDDVLEIGDVDIESISPMPALTRTVETAYLDRVANIHGDLVILLDIEKLLTQSEAESVKKFAEDMNSESGGSNG